MKEEDEMEQIYVNSIKNDPENQCCYVVDYLIRRDNNLTDHIVLECEEPARPEIYPLHQAS